MNVEATAYHEAGHAVVTVALRRKVHSATIIPHADTHGRVHHETPLRGIRLDFDGSPRARLRAEDAIMISLGGGMAQRRAFPRSLRHWHTHGDDTNVTDIAGSVCGSAEEENTFIKWLEARTQVILDLRWHEVERIAAALLERKRLSSKELVELMATTAE
jgi:ATP-dependent Zn protease